MSSAQRILVVASELPPGPGGIGSHAYAVATGLHDLGREALLVGCQHYVDATTREQFNARSPVEIRALPDAPDPVRTAVARACAVQRAITDFRPDVVLASGGRLLWLVVPVARRCGVPMVAVAHGTELGWSGARRVTTRAAFNAADRVIAVSAFTAGLLADMGVRSPAVVVPNGADATRFHPDPALRSSFRERYGLGDRPMVLTVGNMTERKGQYLVVRALPELLRAVPDAVYVMVGQPTNAAELIETARTLEIEGSVKVLGQVDAAEVVAAHAAADVFAMTSTSTSDGDVEGFGIAVVEAALSGVPAVVTRGTGAEEAIVDGQTGLAVDPGSVADALAGLLTDLEMRTSMGAAAEAVARSTGSWAHRVARYADVLDQTASADDRTSRPRIVVVSHTEHWRADDGTIVGFGATTRELDQLASLASELVHVAPLHDGTPPGMALPALAPNVRYVPVRAAGGDGIVAKLAALAVVPHWMWTINREMRRADVAHVRCPAGISMVALVVLLARKRPRDRWVKYAGNWMPPGRDAASYRLQRWWLRRGLARASLTVNGRWPGQPDWVHTFDNPTLTDDELARGREAAAAKQAHEPWRVVFSGRLEQPKGADTAVEAVLELRRRGLDVTLDLIGDGPLRPWVERTINDCGMDGIRLHGWMRRDELEHYLARAHVLLLPTTASEGFPKVIAEAMAFGCVPVTSPISSIGQVLGETGGSVVVQPDESWADAVEVVLNGSWERLQVEGLEHVERFSYSRYLNRVRCLALQNWSRRL